MIDNPQAEMLEATRLTRAGRLTEATVLLQRRLAGMLRSDTATVSPEPWRVPEALRVLFGRAAPIVRGRTAPSGTPIPDVSPEGERFLARSYANQAGAREYRLYVPSGYRGQPIPLIVMLHGCKQSPEDFAAGTRMNAHAEERTCLVAYPGQATSANSSKCWNWVRPAPSAARSWRSVADRRHHRAGNAGLFGRSAAHLRRRAVGRRCCGRDYGSDLPRTLFSGRRALRPCARRCPRPSLRLCRNAAT